MAQLGSLKVNRTESGLIKSGAGTIAGIIVGSHSSGTIKLYDSTTASGIVILPTYTYATGSSVIKFPDDIAFTTGLYATLTNTQDIEIIYN